MMKFHPFRLQPGQDLKNEILNFVRKKNIQAAVLVSGVGSLSRINLRLAGAGGVKSETGNFEIVGFTGTVSINGMHLHIAVANECGQTWGGHLLDGNLILTTCEIVLLESCDHVFTRQQDPQTGYLELIVE